MQLGPIPGPTVDNLLAQKRTRAVQEQDDALGEIEQRATQLSPNANGPLSAEHKKELTSWIFENLNRKYDPSAVFAAYRDFESGLRTAPTTLGRTARESHGDSQPQQMSQGDSQPSFQQDSQPSSSSSSRPSVSGSGSFQSAISNASVIPKRIVPPPTGLHRRTLSEVEKDTDFQDFWAAIDAMVINTKRDNDQLWRQAGFSGYKEKMLRTVPALFDVVQWYKYKGEVSSSSGSSKQSIGFPPSTDEEDEMSISAEEEKIIDRGDRGMLKEDSFAELFYFADILKKHIELPENSLARKWLKNYFKNRPGITDEALRTPNRLFQHWFWTNIEEIVPNFHEMFNAVVKDAEDWIKSEQKKPKELRLKVDKLGRSRLMRMVWRSDDDNVLNEALRMIESEYDLEHGDVDGYTVEGWAEYYSGDVRLGAGSRAILKKILQLGKGRQ